MWFIIDDQMADDRRIKRLPLATVGLWVKLCVIHSKGVSMQAKDPTAYPGHFDKLDLKDAGGTMRQLQQLIDRDARPAQVFFKDFAVLHQHHRVAA